MPLWKKLWLLFAIICVIVAGLHTATILAFAEGVDRDKAWTPLLWGIATPAVVYVLLWLWSLWRRSGKGNSGSDPEFPDSESRR